jgi:hypothetical protein
VIVVDDLLLLEVLAGVAGPTCQAAFEAGEVFTTGSWYWRLANAVRTTRLEGALTRAFNELGSPEQGLVRDHLAELPPSVGLLDYRKLVPVMTAIDLPRPLNMLAADAIATAITVNATILVRTDAPLVRSAAQALDLEYDVVA